MSRPENYNTRQRDSILSFIQSTGGNHFTAAQIAEHFKHEVGRSTVYRMLDLLVESGRLRKYTVDSASGACYQLSEIEDCVNHLHLKCDGCGALIHMECDAIDNLRRHFINEHGFQLDPVKSLLYGKCGECLKNQGV